MQDGSCPQNCEEQGDLDPDSEDDVIAGRICGVGNGDDLDAEAEYGRDSERDYDPDEDRTP